MSDSSGLSRFIGFCFGSWKRIVVTCIVLTALAFAAYGYGVIRSAGIAARQSTAPGSAEEHATTEGGKYTVGAANVPVHPMGLFAEHSAEAAAFPLGPPEASEEKIPAWWEKPSPLTIKEIGFLRYLSALTWKLPRDQWNKYWNIGGNQTGLQTVRFYAAFTGYAAVALGMRTPAYTGLTSKIVLSAIEHLLDRKAWSYVRLLWKNKPWYPDPAADENIMYTGHLLQLMVFYEMMTGDDRFRTEGFDLVWDEDTKFHYDVMKLVDITVKQMRRNPTGGVACEPRHIFFTCNTHPHVALRVLEGLGLGDWSADRAKWEKFVLDSFYDELGGGAIKCVYHQDKKKFFPIGFPGMDGWSLMWYSTWAADPTVPESLWQITRKRTSGDLFKRRGFVKREKPKLHGTADFVSYLFAIVQATLPPIPAATFLYPAASACNDKESAARLRQEIEKRFLKTRHGMAFLKIPHRFNIGSNANMALGLALENGSNMRHLVQRPLPRDYLEGPLITDARPDTVVVGQAFREDRDLVVEFASLGPSDFALKNVPGIRSVEGIPAGDWSYKDGVLHIEASGRHQIRIVVEP
ncbi:MAG: hypothetical protein GY854_09620 [Deltaproteobacteria bacterium]|nr:hypothetical protein [Deltaproteobacteria bacterium]